MPSIAATLAAVADLDTTDQPWSFEVEDGTIVGRWKVTDSRWFAPGSVRDEHKDYTVRVDFDEQAGEFDLDETITSTTTKAGLGGASMRKSGFRGTTFGVTSVEIGIGKEKDGDEGVRVHEVRFVPEDMKAPLREFLAALGWSLKRKSVWKRLTGR